ncbi:hypothetical protein HPB48_018893 [Haemaphysalis longicornis]|uniref:Amidohydrolase n=1 Tax=Haemaphysalis longicornis TaxID=44386 RepID=A0A9J6G3N2_HAELO|nr:hypothetical protein HPB48_018893 [Haemaphysalis longicornis]
MSLPESLHAELRQLSDDLWSCPELSGDEQFAQERLCDVLRERDFFVMPGFLLPTAFCSELVFNEDGGPTVCLVCEYDAVAGLGHAAGHNLASTAAVAAALAVQIESSKAPNPNSHAPPTQNWWLRNFSEIRSTERGKMKPRLRDQKNKLWGRDLGSLDGASVR